MGAICSGETPNQNNEIRSDLPAGERKENISDDHSIVRAVKNVQKRYEKIRKKGIGNCC